MYIIIVLSFLFYTYTYYYILLIIFSRDYLEIFGGRFGRIWMAPVIYVQNELFLGCTGSPTYVKRTPYSGYGTYSTVLSLAGAAVERKN